MLALSRKFFKLSGADKAATLEAMFNLARARLEVKVYKFKNIAASLGDLVDKCPEQKLYPEVELLRVKESIQRTRGNLPWRNVCLPQALAALRMLTRHKIGACLYFGTKYTDSGSLIAHAWVKSGDMFITGKRGHNDYTIVAVFKNRV